MSTLKLELHFLLNSENKQAFGIHQNLRINDNGQMGRVGCFAQIQYENTQFFDPICFARSNIRTLCFAIQYICFAQIQCKDTLFCDPICAQAPMSCVILLPLPLLELALSTSKQKGNSATSINYLNMRQCAKFNLFCKTS